MATDYKLRVKASDQTKQGFNSVNKNINTTQSAMKKLAGAFAGVFAVRQIVNFANETLALADSIGKVADSIGVQTEFLQRYQFAAQQSGLTTEEFNKGMQNFTKMVGQAQLRTSEAGRSLQKLGVQVKNTDGSIRSSEDVFIDLFEALDGVGSQFEKNAILADLMGRAGVKLAVMGKDGAEAMKELAASATGIIPEESIRQAEIFNDTMNELKRATLLPLQQVVIATSNTFLDLLDTIGLIERKKTIPLLEEELAGLETQLKRTQTAAGFGMQGTITDLLGLTTGDVEGTKARIAEIKKELQGLSETSNKFKFDESQFEKMKTQFKGLNTVASTLTSSFKTFFDFTNKEFLNFGKLAEKIVASVINELIRIHIIKKVLGFGASAFGEDSFLGSAFKSALDNFEGGGFTGMGARVGGLDGRGGRLAMVHPNETVIDHTKGQAMGGATVNFNISTVDAAGFDQLLASRKGLITSIINNAMNNQGKMGVV
jgi:hypothetical protein